MTRLPRYVAVLGLGAAALAGCGGGTAADAGRSPSPAAVVATPGAHRVQQVTIDATDMLRFDPMRIIAHPGTVRITLTDTGSYPHNIDFPSLHVMSRNVSGDPGGMSTTVMVRVDKPGRYPFKCTFHSSSGMTGLLVVS